MLTHANLSFVTVSWLADLTPITDADVTLHAAPLTHGAGFHALLADCNAAPTRSSPTGAASSRFAILELMRHTGVTSHRLVPGRSSC